MTSWALSLCGSFSQPILACGRGIVKLIEGLSEGDPVAWGIVDVIVLFIVGKLVYSSMQNKSSSDEGSSDKEE